jgi:putative redox protein
MGELVEVAVASIDEKVRCSAAARSNPSITFDYRAPIGNGQGYTGLEGLLMSLAACSGTTLVYLLRKMNRNVSGFKVNAKGERKDHPPLSLEKIHLEFIVASDNTDEGTMKKALDLTKTHCPVWAMLKNNVEIRMEGKIIAS